MSDFRKFLDEQLEDPEFKAEWDALQPERALVQAMIDARKRTGMTQQQLADTVGVVRTHISNMERGRFTASVPLAASGGGGQSASSGLSIMSYSMNG